MYRSVTIKSSCILVFASLCFSAPTEPEQDLKSYHFRSNFVGEDQSYGRCANITISAPVITEQWSCSPDNEDCTEAKPFDVTNCDTLKHSCESSGSGAVWQPSFYCSPEGVEKPMPHQNPGEENGMGFNNDYSGFVEGVSRLPYLLNPDRPLDFELGEFDIPRDTTAPGGQESEATSPAANEETAHVPRSEDDIPHHEIQDIQPILPPPEGFSDDGSLSSDSLNPNLYSSSIESLDENQNGLDNHELVPSRQAPPVPPRTYLLEGNNEVVPPPGGDNAQHEPEQHEDEVATANRPAPPVPSPRTNPPAPVNELENNEVDPPPGGDNAQHGPEEHEDEVATENGLARPVPSPRTNPPARVKKQAPPVPSSRTYPEAVNEDGHVNEDGVVLRYPPGLRTPPPPSSNQHHDEQPHGQNTNEGQGHNNEHQPTPDLLREVPFHPMGAPHAPQEMPSNQQHPPVKPPRAGLLSRFKGFFGKKSPPPDHE